MGGVYGGQTGAVWYCPTLIIGCRSSNDAGRITYLSGTSAAPRPVLATITTFGHQSYSTEDRFEPSASLDHRMSATDSDRLKIYGGLEKLKLSNPGSIAGSYIDFCIQLYCFINPAKCSSPPSAFLTKVSQFSLIHAASCPAGGKYNPASRPATIAP